MIIWDLSNIYGGDVRYLRSRFPDGQPHLQVLNRKDLRPDNGPIEIITNIRSAEDVLELGMALDIVRRWSGFEQVGLTIGYLMGARMDRAIDDTQPLTLKVILAFLRSVVGVFETVRVLDVHSDIGAAIFAPKVLERLQPTRLWTRAISGMTPLTGEPPTIVSPDEGALLRYRELDTSGIAGTAYCVKHRDPQTGRLSGFKLVDGDVKGKHCLIIDDICDGGGTFVGLAKVLREAGAESVNLCVTHGLFAKGLPLEGIDDIWTTDTVCHRTGTSDLHVMHNYLLDEVKSWATK